MNFIVIFIFAIFSYEAEGSTFSCEGRVPGYYADIETGCRTYHYCIGNKQYSYECPNNTLFQQRIFICNHWYLVNCENSEQFYNANLLIGQKDKPFVGDEENGVSVPATTQTESTVYSTLEAEQPETSPTYNYEELRKTNFTLDSEDIQSVEKKSEEDPPPTSQAKEAARTGKSNGIEDVHDNFIKLIFADPRGLFYIPDDNYSPEPVPPIFREFLIPKISDEAEVMQFKESSKRSQVACPKYCHSRFIKPGTCHPCIMIK